MLHYRTRTLTANFRWLVFLHGVGGDSKIWHRQLREFSKYYNLLFIDLRGHGESEEVLVDRGYRKYTLEEITREVMEVLEHLHITRAGFIGVSLGTIVARALAEMKPSMVQCMVLAGAVVKFNTRSKFLIWVAQRSKNLIPYKLLYKMYAHILMPKKEQRHSRSMFITSSRRLTRDGFLSWMTITTGLSMALSYFWETELPIPTLYVMGEHDYIFLSQVRKLLKTQNRYSRLEVIPRAGHICNLDEWKVFNPLTLRFLENNCA